MVGGSFWAELALLRTTRFARRCNIVVMLRVREPLSWYRSYFDWAVLSRQKTGNAPQWGVNFTDWLPANMQARFLLHGTRGQPSEWAPEVARFLRHPCSQHGRRAAGRGPRPRGQRARRLERRPVVVPARGTSSGFWPR